VVAAGVEEIRTLLEEAGYTTVEPGALALALEGRPVSALGNSDLGTDPPVALGRGRWSLLSAMDPTGAVALSFTGTDVLETADSPYGVRTNVTAMGDAIEETLSVPCMTTFIDPGDTARADSWANQTGRVDRLATDQALLRADILLGHLRATLHRHQDLLIVVSPTSPAWDEDVHFGVAVAVGPGFPPGSYLVAPSTRRNGLVTLPDIAPTILQHHGVARPPSMLGRAMYARGSGGPERIRQQVDMDKESVFIDSMRAPVSTGFVILQVLLYAIVAFVLWRRGERGPSSAKRPLPRGFVVGGLAVMAFPMATYLSGLTDQVAFGVPGLIVGLLAIDLVIVTAVCLVVRDPFDRLLAVGALTYLVLIGDLVTGANLQVNTVFSYSPLVAGRFAGIGNIAYSVLAAVTVITAALLVHREEGSRRSLGIAGGLFVVAVIVDASPRYGADVGGILALVPGLWITWMLLAGRRPNLRTMALVLGGMVLAVGVFLAIDLAQPEESRTHLGRLFEDAKARGLGVFVDVLGRKLETNLRVFRSTVWTYLVPPALGLIAWLLVRPRNRWQKVAEKYPRLRAGLVSCLIVAVLGFAVNDSGIVVPAMMLALLAPLALVMHLTLDEERS
jgi:hypothetical protein